MKTTINKPKEFDAVLLNQNFLILR